MPNVVVTNMISMPIYPKLKKNPDGLKYFLHYASTIKKIEIHVINDIFCFYFYIVFISLSRRKSYQLEKKGSDLKSTEVINKFYLTSVLT